MYYYWKLQDSKAYEAGPKSKSIQVHVGPKDHGWPQAEKVKISNGIGSQPLLHVGETPMIFHGMFGAG